VAEPRPLIVQIEYFDAGDGSFVLEYDSLDLDAPEHGVYKATEPVAFQNTQQWRTHRFELPDVSYRSRQYDGGGDFRIHDIPGEDGQLHAFGRVVVSDPSVTRPVPLAPESLSFVDPSAREPVTLRWSPVSGAAGYLVLVQPLDAESDDQHGFTAEDRARCVGQADIRSGQQNRGLSQHPTCEILVAGDLDEGVYRWRVQALDGDSNPVGEASDWGYFVAAHR
jgi:hypothetical protein